MDRSNFLPKLYLCRSVSFGWKAEVWFRHNKDYRECKATPALIVRGVATPNPVRANLIKNHETVTGISPKSADALASLKICRARTRRKLRVNVPQSIREEECPLVDWNRAIPRWDRRLLWRPIRFQCSRCQGKQLVAIHLGSPKIQPLWSLLLAACLVKPLAQLPCSSRISPSVRPLLLCPGCPQRGGQY